MDLEMEDGGVWLVLSAGAFSCVLGAGQCVLSWGELFWVLPF